MVWDVASLFGGKSETLDIVVTVDPDTPAETLTSTAVVAGDQPAPDSTNNAVEEETTVTFAGGAAQSPIFINVFDVIIDLQIIVGQAEPTRPQTILSDLNQDGTINVFDAIIALQHIVGLIPTLDHCGLPVP